MINLNRIIQILLAAAAVVPYSFVAGLEIFYSKATEELGYAPWYGYPDPNELELYKGFGRPLIILCEATAYLVFPWLLASFAVLSFRRQVAEISIFVFGLIGFSLAASMIFSPRFTWFID